MDDRALEPSVETLEDALRLFEDKGGTWEGVILNRYFNPAKIEVMWGSGPHGSIKSRWYQPIPEITEQLIAEKLLIGIPVMGGRDNMKLLLSTQGKQYLANIRTERMSRAREALGKIGHEHADTYRSLGEIRTWPKGDTDAPTEYGMLFDIFPPLVVFPDNRVCEFNHDSGTYSPQEKRVVA